MDFFFFGGVSVFLVWLGFSVALDLVQVENIDEGTGQLTADISELARQANTSIDRQVKKGETLFLFFCSLLVITVEPVLCVELEGAMRHSFLPVLSRG